MPTRKNPLVVGEDQLSDVTFLWPSRTKSINDFLQGRPGTISERRRLHPQEHAVPVFQMGLRNGLLPRG